MGANESVFFDRNDDRFKRLVLRADLNSPPALSAVVNLPGSGTTSPTAAEFLAYTKANKQFEILGTNAATADATLATGGGVTLSAHSTTNDITVMLPHLTAGSPFTTTLWDTSKSPTFNAIVQTSSSIASQVIYCGFKLTNTPTLATDNDQAYFSYDTSATASTVWNYNYSIGGTDYIVAVPTDVCPIVAASTVYELRIEIYSDRTHMGFINNRPIASAPFAALTSLTTFIPYNGVKSLTTAAKSFTVKDLVCTRLYA